MTLFTGLMLCATLASAMTEVPPKLWSNPRSDRDIQELFKRTNPVQSDIDVLIARAIPMCQHDNLYSIFLDPRYSSSASAFCSTYLTSTSVSTIVPLTAQILAAKDIVLATETTTSHGPDATVTADAELKNQAPSGCPGIASTYPASLASSACLCLLPPAATISTTMTELASTITTASILDLTATALGSTMPVTVIGPTTATATATATVQDSAIQPAPVSPAYCSMSFVIAGTLETPFEVQCYSSYGRDAKDYLSVASYEECAGQAGDNFFSLFSFFRNIESPEPNCFVYHSYPAQYLVGDPDVDSGTAVYEGGQI